MEHHSNIVPWQLLCQEVGAELDYVEVHRRRHARPRLARRGRSRAGRSSSRSRTCRTCSARSTRSPRSRAARTTPARSCWSTARRPCRTTSVDVRELGADFYGFTGHKLYGPTGVGVLYGRRELLEEMPPFLGGGDMISSVDFQESRWNSLPWKFEAGTSPFTEAAGLGTAVEWFAGLGIDSGRRARARR